MYSMDILILLSVMNRYFHLGFLAVLRGMGIAMPRAEPVAPGHKWRRLPAGYKHGTAQAEVCSARSGRRDGADRRQAIEFAASEVGETDPPTPRAAERWPGLR